MYHFIINPNSRSGQGELIWQQIKARLEQEKIPYKAYKTGYPGHDARLAAMITAENENPTIIVMGGDGTIHGVLTGIRDLDRVVFGFIPTGSGNDFCRGMGIPHDAMRAYDNIMHCTSPSLLDVPYVKSERRNQRFGISAGIGYDAAVCHEVASSPAKDILNRLHLGKLVYLAVALKQILFLTPRSASLVLDGNRRFRYQKMYFAAVMNQKYEGGGFKFCPEALTDDGLLDVIVVEGLSRLRILVSLPSAFWGGHVKIPGIHVFQCRKADISCSSPMAVHLDGEAAGVRKKLSVRLEPQKIKILL